MNIVVSNEGERYLLALALNLASADLGVLQLRVYANDYTPTRDVTLADLTEATFSGYVPTALDPSLWSAPETLDGAAASWWDGGVVLFTPSAGVVICYGMYVTNAAGDVLIWAGRFSAPQTVTPSAPCVVQAAVELRSQSEPT